MKKKVIALALGCTVAFGCAVGGTLAWLTDSTTEVKNTFTTSDITIELTETTTDYQMVPGHTIAKDPKVTVKKGSEECYVFVKITETDAKGKNSEDTDVTYDFDQFLNYNVITTGDNAWTALDGVDGVYYREVAANTESDQSFYILVGQGDGELKNGYVTVKDTVDKDMMNALGSDKNNYPTLTFTAYAIQKNYLTDQNNDDKVDQADGWILLNPTTTP